MNAYDKLVKFQKDYPELTFDNDGYEYLSQEVKEKHEEQIKEIEAILKEEIEGFERFDNFKPRKYLFAVRFHYNWSHGTAHRYFSGVGYFHIDEFKT